MGRFLFENAILLDPEASEPGSGHLLVDDGRIAEVFREEQAPALNCPRVDLAGQALAPGFVDLHFHGGLAIHDAGRFDAILNASSASLAESGTTAFLATTVARPHLELTRGLTQLASSLERSEWSGARPLGVHLEGPWINAAAAGAQPEAGIRPFDAAEARELSETARGTLRMVTLAPEIPGSSELLAFLEKSGLLVALGHSLASCDVVRDAVERGASHVTHLFNAMGAMHHRAPGLAGTALTDDRLTVDVICDGVHVDPAMIALAARAKRSQLLLISDRIELTHHDAPSNDALVTQKMTHDSMGGRRVIDDGTTLRLEDGRLAGSRLRLDTAIGRFQAYSGVPRLEAIAAATLRPARALGIEASHGTLRPGARADLVVLDPANVTRETWVGGERVYAKPA
jgi:N-acetylglucosamine-6-phosphate deacetylase